MKIFSFLELLVLRWKSSNIAPFMEHPVYIFFNVENVFNLACWFSFYTSCPSFMFKTYLFLNFVCSTKEASIFFFLWSTIYLVFSMCKASWFLTAGFTLSLVTQNPFVKRLYSQSSTCSAKKQRCWYGTLKNGLNLCWLWFVTAYKDSLHETY